MTLALYEADDKIILSILQETWVLADSNANGPGELSVQRGQQVEVVGLPPSGNAPASTASAASITASPAPEAGNNMVIVRLSSGSEGLVPLTCLKQPTGGFKFKNGLGSLKDEGECKAQRRLLHDGSRTDQNVAWTLRQHIGFVLGFSN